MPHKLYLIAIFCLTVLIPQSGLAQTDNTLSKITGHVYELSTGEPLEGVRIDLKNRQGLDVSRVEPAYTNAEGYFEILDLNPNDYRAEITHIFETPNGPLGLRLFTSSQPLVVTDDPFELDIALSSHSLKLLEERRHTGNISAAMYYATSGEPIPKEFNDFLTKHNIKIPSSQEEKDEYYRQSGLLFQKQNILGSRLLTADGFIGAMENIQRIRISDNQ